MYNITYMWNLEKMVQMKSLTYYKQSHRCRLQAYGFQGGKGEWTNWEIEIDIYILLCKKQITNENLLFNTENATQLSWVS